MWRRALHRTMSHSSPSEWATKYSSHLPDDKRLLSSVQSLSRVQLFVTPWTAARLPCPSPTPRACSNSWPSSQWCHPTISSSVVPFSSCPQSFPASGSFPRSQFFTSGGQSILDLYLISNQVISSWLQSILYSMNELLMIWNCFYSSA